MSAIVTDNKAEPIPAAVWRVASVVVFGAFMGTLDTSLVNVGLKTIGAELDSSLDAVQWVGSAYLLAMAVSLPLCGWLGRRVGVTHLWIGAVAAVGLAPFMVGFLRDYVVLLSSLNAYGISTVVCTLMSLRNRDSFDFDLIGERVRAFQQPETTP